MVQGQGECSESASARTREAERHERIQRPSATTPFTVARPGRHGYVLALLSLMAMLGTALVVVLGVRFQV